MNKSDAIDYAIEKMNSHNYIFSRCVSRQVLESEWADFFVATGTLKERPDKLWNVRFVRDPSSENTVCNRNSISVLINDATGEYGFYD